MIIEEEEKKNIANVENETLSCRNMINETLLNDNLDKLKENNDNVQKCFESLNNTIENMNIHINSILKDNEEKYILAFNTYMYDVQKEIRILKKILKEERIKELKDEKMKKLQKELKWYINECLRLDKISQYLKKEAEKWKRNSELMKNHMLFLEKKLSKTFEKVIEKQYIKKEEEKKTIEYKSKDNKKDISNEKKDVEKIEKEDEKKVENKLKDKEKKDNLYNKMNLKINDLEKKLKKQININSSLQERLTKHYIEKSKYEKLFIDCSKQIKKDIEKQKMINDKERYIEKNFSLLLNESELSYFTKEDKKKLLITFFSSTDLIEHMKNNIFNKEKMSFDINNKNSYTRINYQRKSDISPFIL
ncbi:conserved Plasmodium protein, unknown function [Plasmodium relictum]|uniref:Uncharacterized protein n=1 Tax=Plasmodium relictum TaxID=85471 RepID=A0A1J1H9B0_PLARL|nr:conserved Plasmodium protein, unknown function [Plasmodium relictum]CRH01095.1 conserved Plasmodium protein, unknown function [Plasmodium relictum]